MKIIKVEYLIGKEKIILPEPWLPAWWMPNGKAITELSVGCYKLYTDDGLIGYGPYTGADGDLAINRSPFMVGDFYEHYMSGNHSKKKNCGASGLEIAMWDIIGKAAKLPLYKVLGASRNKIFVYASTSRILPINELVELVKQIKDEGFKGLKIRLHRDNVDDDIKAAEAVRKAVGDNFILCADANQDNHSSGYKLWDRVTAAKVSQSLENLNYLFIEEPLPMKNSKDTAMLRNKYNILIAGGEHAETIHDYKMLINEGSYDIYQPDICLRGNFGITGMRNIMTVAEYNNLQVIPHISSDANVGINLLATMHIAVSSNICTMLEYPYDPDVLTPLTTQPLVKKKLEIDHDGYLRLPDKPGLGINFDESAMTVVKEWRSDVEIYL